MRNLISVSIASLGFAFLALISAPAALFAQEQQAIDPLQYADLADLATDASIIARVKVNKAIRVDAERVQNAPPNSERFYVIAETLTLIRGSNGLPQTIRYLIDLPLDARGRAPRIRRDEFLIFARSAGPADVQLVAPDAHIRWTPTREQRVRAIVSEAVARNAPPAVRSIASAFHVPGTVIGEGETQIFLDTVSGDPISITILARAGQQKIWAVSLSEIVDEAARAPTRNSLLWYRLACFLPQTLPQTAMASANAFDNRRAQADYAMVMQDLGRCPRTRGKGGLPLRLY